MPERLLYPLPHNTARCGRSVGRREQSREKRHLAHLLRLLWGHDEAMLSPMQHIIAATQKDIAKGCVAAIAGAAKEDIFPADLARE